MGIWGGGGSRAPKPKSRVDVHYFFFGASWREPYFILSNSDLV